MRTQAGREPGFPWPTGCRDVPAFGCGASAQLFKNTFYTCVNSPLFLCILCFSSGFNLNPRIPGKSADCGYVCVLVCLCVCYLQQGSASKLECEFQMCLNPTPHPPPRSSWIQASSVCQFVLPRHCCHYIPRLSFKRCLLTSSIKIRPVPSSPSHFSCLYLSPLFSVFIPVMPPHPSDSGLRLLSSVYRSPQTWDTGAQTVTRGRRPRLPWPLPLSLWPWRQSKIHLTPSLHVIFVPCSPSNALMPSAFGSCMCQTPEPQKECHNVPSIHSWKLLLHACFTFFSVGARYS